MLYLSTLMPHLLFYTGLYYARLFSLKAFFANERSHFISLRADGVEADAARAAIIMNTASSREALPASR